MFAVFYILETLKGTNKNLCPNYAKVYNITIMELKKVFLSTGQKSVSIFFRKKLDPLRKWTTARLEVLHYAYKTQSDSAAVYIDIP